MICTFKCVVCGVECRKRRSPANVKTAPKYCSQKCHGIDQQGSGSGITPNVIFDCVVCGKRVETYRSPSATIDARYCSLKCLGIAQLGEGNPSFTGGRVVMNNGYINILNPSHPHADARGYMLEHRLVVEERIGRILGRKEIVHHIDGNPSNNESSNLQLFASQAEHLAKHRSLR